LKYLENGDRYEVGPPGLLICRTHGLSIGTVRFELGSSPVVPNGYTTKCSKPYWS